MRAVIQNVKDCYLRIDNEVFSSIDSGFLILISFTQGDDLNLAKKFIDKIITLRVFPDENGKTNLSLKDINGQIMCVSQFTLYADVAKGRRPSFVNALAFDKASILYDDLAYNDWNEKYEQLTVIANPSIDWLRNQLNRDDC